MKVAAVIVSYNSSAELPRSLGALRALPLARIIVADNGSKDDSVEVARQYTEHVLQLANDGFGAGNNAAVATVPDADAYLLLNPDAAIAPDDFARLVAALAEDPKLGLVGPMMRYPDGRYGVASGSEPSMAKEWLAALRVDHAVPAGVKRALANSTLLRSKIKMLDYVAVEPSPETRPVDWVSGFCMLVRADAFRAVNGFDEQFFLYFEDVDLCVRLRAAGWGVATVGSSVAEHTESTSTGAVGKNQLYRDGMDTYFNQHGTRVQRLLAKALRKSPV
ncbi:glycosyltransferase family 2 protein [Dactylosporangium sp. NPDC051541]|uniref:glycosyltransferase family 2 protein n=1 Tax=Dactylosporangium sp. NPDC051541 TaxID=3363977 RepID=UPI0037B29684